MLSLGLAEMMVVVGIAVVVVGPDRLPKAVRQMGRWYGQLRRSADELRRAFVLEADRQEATERYQKLRQRREEAVEAADAPNDIPPDAPHPDRPHPRAEDCEE